jgi:hypothetical protein
VTVGFVILAHEHLGRVAELARALAREDARVAIHVDAKVRPRAMRGLEAAVADDRFIRFAPRVRCEWGTFSLVEATQGAAGLVLASWPEVTHVFLLSGACLPVRPVAELKMFLERGGRTDYIESVNVGAERWVQGGLSEERFTLHFPFSWRRRRRLFDLAVKLQRRFGMRRRLPQGLSPHIGSQWWCLSRETLTAILRDPRRAEFDAFFARSWIPDETYFQTLVRRHAVRIESRSLTLSRFDHQGKPHTFYDDHEGLLAQSDAFFARKIWHGADRLYRRLLAPGRSDFRGLETPARALEHPFREAHRRRCEGRPGFLSQSRFPSPWYERRLATPGPYVVFDGFDALLPGLGALLDGRTALHCHGRVYARDRVELAGGGPVWRGNILASPAVRDREPEQYLLNLLRQGGAEGTSLQFVPTDSARMARVFRADPNARILRLEDGWLLALFRETGGAVAEAKRALARFREEAARLDRGRPVAAERATVTAWPLAEAIADPGGVLCRAVTEALPLARRGPLPAHVPPGFAAFASALGYPGAARLFDAEKRAAVRRALYAEARDASA